MAVKRIPFHFSAPIFLTQTPSSSTAFAAEIKHRQKNGVKKMTDDEVNAHGKATPPGNPYFCGVSFLISRP
jgi:hypothetical protein